MTVVELATRLHLTFFAFSVNICHYLLCGSDVVSTGGHVVDVHGRGGQGKQPGGNNKCLQPEWFGR